MKHPFYYHCKLQALSFLLLTVCSLFNFSSCSKHKTKITKINPIQTVTNFSDTIYLSSQVSNITYTNGKYYLSDLYRGLVSFDNSFTTFVREKINACLPQSPRCYMFAVNGNDSVCIYDAHSKLFLNTTRDTMIVKAEVGRHEVSFPSRFVLNGDSILCSIIKDNMTVAVIYKGKVADTCFPTIRGLDDIRKPYHSDRMIVRDNHNYYTIGKGLPIVQMFSTDLKLVSSYNLNEIEEIAKTVEQEKSDKPNSYFVVVQDACVANGKLFLLISSKNNNKYRCNNVVTLKTANNTIEFDGIYELKGDVYSTLCVNGKGQIVIVNAKTASVEVYEL